MACAQTVTRAGGEYNTLIAYPPEIISTQSCNPALQMSVGGGLDSDFKAINYTAFQEQTSFCSGREYPVEGNPNIWSSRAYPFVLSFPPGLDSVDPNWKTYSVFAYGALDPPRTLVKTSAMIDPGQRINPSVKSNPEARPTPVRASATPTLDPPATTAVHSDSPAQAKPPAAIDPSSGAFPPANINSKPETDPPAEVFSIMGLHPPTAAQPSPGANPTRQLTLQVDPPSLVGYP